VNKQSFLRWLTVNTMAASSLYDAFFSCIIHSGARSWDYQMQHNSRDRSGPCNLHLANLASGTSSAVTPLYMCYRRIEVHDCMVEMARSVAKAHAQPHQWALNTMQGTARLPRVSTAASRTHLCAPPLPVCVISRNQPAGSWCKTPTCSPTGYNAHSWAAFPSCAVDVVSLAGRRAVRRPSPRGCGAAQQSQLPRRPGRWSSC
jgi:hypothetical protein